MAVTANIYNHTTNLLNGQTIHITDIWLMLLSSSAVFVATDTTVDAVAGAAAPHRAKEVYGNSWPEGGKNVTGVASSTITTNDAKLSGSQISQTASGGDIGPARFVLEYDKTTMKPLILYDLGQDEHAGDSTDFKLTFDLSGTPGTMWTVTV